MPAKRDVIIAGGGPAGLATAIALSQKGLKCTVVDRGEPPIEKACGEGMMPAGVEALERLGVHLTPKQGRPFRGIRYVDQDSTVRADFAGCPGLAVRRPVLHQALVDRAKTLEIGMLWNRRIEGLTDRGLLTDEGAMDATWIVGADGLRSSIRSWAGLDAASPHRGHRGKHARFGIRRHYELDPWSEDVEVYWGDGCEAYVWGLPGPSEADSARGQVGVSMLWSGRKASFDLLLEQFPELAKRLEQGTRATKDRGAGPFDQRVRAVADGRVALVGDAAGYRDPITGEGLALAFQQALALADCLADSPTGPREANARRPSPLTAYRHRVAKLSRRPYAFIRLLLAIEARPRLRRRILSALAHEPTAFATMLALHDGAPLTGATFGPACRFAGRFAFGSATR